MKEFRDYTAGILNLVISCAIIVFLLMLTSCGTLKTVNNPYNKKQLLWGKVNNEGIYMFNNYYRVSKEFYNTYRIGDEFEFKKGDIIK